MTDIQFAEVIGKISAGCGKSLSAESQLVYFDCLGDLDYEVFKLAAKRVLLSHPWATFPSIAELREAAALTARGEVVELSPAKAWELAWQRIGGVDLEIRGPYHANGKVYADQLAAALDGLPDVLVKAIRAFGIPSLAYGDDPPGVKRGQFMKVYEQIADDSKREAIMPADTRKAIEAIGERKELPAPVRLALAGIGKAVGE